MKEPGATDFQGKGTWADFNAFLFKIQGLGMKKPRETSHPFTHSPSLSWGR
jgi:hypothetical protein